MRNLAARESRDRALATWQMQSSVILFILGMVGLSGLPRPGVTGRFSRPCECFGKEPMLKTILITGTIGMIVGFGGTLMSLFGGGTLQMEYLEFLVMVALFLVMLIGAYWFVALNPRGEAKKPTSYVSLERLPRRRTRTEL